MLKVVIVDDEPSVLEGLRIFIDWNREGYEIVGEASDGMAALPIIRERQPDIVICDIRMPGFTGLELMEKTNAETGTVPKFIMLSGYNDFSYAQRALQLGAIGYMTKPLDPKELLSELSHAANIIENDEKTNRENLELIRYSANQLFNDVINGKPSMKLRRKANFIFGTPERAKMRIIHFVTIPDSDSNHTCDTRIYDFLVRVLDIKSENCVFYNGNGIYIIILYEYMGSFPSHTTLYKIMLNELGRMSPSDIGLRALWTLISGISDTDVLESICSCSRQLDQLHIYSMLHPEKKVVCYEALDKKALMRGQVSQTSGAVPAESLYGSIIDAIKGNDVDRVSAAVEEFFHELYQKIGTDRLISVYLYRLADVVRKTASAFEIEAGKAIFEFTASIGKRDPGCKQLAVAMCSHVFERLNCNNDKSLVLLENEIIDYIKTNSTMKSLSIQNIAENFSLPAMIISKIIKKKTGKKFNDYVNILRIEHAKMLFSSEDMKIAAVCDQSGYLDYGYFTKKFKEITGVLPSDYKKKYS